MDFSELVQKISELASTHPKAKVYLDMEHGHQESHWGGVKRLTSLHSDRGDYETLAIDDGNWNKDAMTVKKLAKKLEALQSKKSFLLAKGGEYTPSQHSPVLWANGNEPGFRRIVRISTPSEKVVFLYAVPDYTN